MAKHRSNRSGRARGTRPTSGTLRVVPVGGIYARPLAAGNVLHFVVGALALLEHAYGAPGSAGIWVIALMYSVLAFAFGYVLFTHPADAVRSHVRRGS